MVRFVVRRLLQMVVAFFGTTLVVDAMMFGAQGDPVQALAGDKPVSAAQRSYLTACFHLDHGFWWRYADYVRRLARGALRRTLTMRPIPAVLGGARPYTRRVTCRGMVHVRGRRRGA